MATTTFDTLAFVEEWKASGFDDAQAKGMVGVLKVKCRMRTCKN
ncbi:MAG: CCDC90 family protein [Magnetococcus sp. THC-1_WYH]